MRLAMLWEEIAMRFRGMGSAGGMCAPIPLSGNFTRGVCLAIALGVVAGCAENGSEPAPPDDAPPPATTDASAAADADENAAQTMRDLFVAKQAMPGRPIYDASCGSCHNGAVAKAPHRDMIGLMPPEMILRSLTDGIMREEAAALSGEQKVQVSEYLAGVVMGEAPTAIPACGEDIPAIDPQAISVVQNWGFDLGNTRHIPAAEAALGHGDLANLDTRFAIRFPGANRARSQPTLAAGSIFVGSHSGHVYALDEATGCAHWTYSASAEVRTGIALAPGEEDGQSPLALFGDVLGNVYGVNAATGEGVWRQRADDHPNATITGTPRLYEGRLYVPVSSLEVSLAVDPYYECCTFRGSVAAYAARTGEPLWKTYTIDEPAVVQSQNRAGTNMRGPSGAVIWNSPSIDVRRNQLYVGTGENMSSPATLTSDAIFAIDLDSGNVNWVFQATANDVWNVACDTDTDHSCPPEGGPDFDFGAATLFVTTSDSQDLVLGGQKSGFVHALNPDTGKLVWQTQVGRGGVQGGIHFGMAAAGDTLFVPISDMPDGREYPTPDKPGLHALDLRTGKLKWYTPNPDRCEGRMYCHPGISQAITTTGELVFAGAMDGVLRVHDAESGDVLWEVDTTGSFATTTGETTFGGSFSGGAGPVVRNGNLYLSSGYGLYNHMAGNLLLVLAAPPDS